MATYDEIEHRLAALEAAFNAERQRNIRIEAELIGENVELGKRWWALLLKYEPDTAEKLAGNG